MDTKRYTAAELAGMKPARLQEVATAAGIKKPFHKNLNAADKRERILKHYAKLDAAAIPDATPAAAGRPVNAAFEAKCDTLGPVPAGHGDSPNTDASTQAPDGRGGVRPGAGCPRGMTDEAKRMTHVTETPHKLVVAAFKMLFKGWASWVGTDKVELTEEQAIDVALPWSQGLEYLGYTDHIPQWAEIFIMGVWQTWNTFFIKARIAREFREAKKQETGTAKPTTTQGEADGQSGRD